MSLTPFKNQFENWEIGNTRQWIAPTDRRTAAKFVSDEVDRIVAAQLETADRIIVSQERVESGIDRVALGGERIANGLEDLAAAFDWAFSEVIWHLERQRGILEEILAILQAPLGTQAKELKKRAEDAYRNGWINDAVEDFLESEEKNRYDFTIHQSLGNIYLFHKKNLEKALEYYEKAVKYATPRSSYYASVALLHVGLVYYLQEHFEKAHEATLKAVELSPSLCEAHYQHAQYSAHLGEYTEAIEHLTIAIAGDRNYCLKADSEQDFDVMKGQIRLLFEGWRVEAQNQARDEIEEAQESILRAESYVLSSPGDFSSATDRIQIAKRKVSEAEELLERNSLFDSWDAIDKTHVAQDVALYAQKLTLNASAEYYADQISRAKSARDGKEKELEKNSEVWRNRRWGCFLLSITFGSMAGLGFVAGNSGAKILCWGAGALFLFSLMGRSIVELPAMQIFGKALNSSFLIRKTIREYEERIAKFQQSLLEIQARRDHLGAEYIDDV